MQWAYFLGSTPPLSGCQSLPGLLHFEEIPTTFNYYNLFTTGILGGIGRSKLFRCFPISVGWYLFLPYQIPHRSLAPVFSSLTYGPSGDSFHPTAPKKGKTAGINGCLTFPRHPVIFSADDWDVQSHPQQSIWVPLPFSEGDWIPRDPILILENNRVATLRIWNIQVEAFRKTLHFMAH